MVTWCSNRQGSLRHRGVISQVSVHAVFHIGICSDLPVTLHSFKHGLQLLLHIPRIYLSILMTEAWFLQLYLWYSLHIQQHHSVVVYLGQWAGETFLSFSQNSPSQSEYTPQRMVSNCIVTSATCWESWEIWFEDFQSVKVQLCLNVCTIVSVSKQLKQ